MSAALPINGAVMGSAALTHSTLFAAILTAFLAGFAGNIVAATPEPAGWEIKSATMSPDAKTIHLLYDNGKTSTFTVAKGEVGFDAPWISEDRRSAAWGAEGYADASYPILLSIYTLRNGKQTPNPDGFDRCGGDNGGGAPIGSEFLAGGKQIAMDYAYPHGVPYEHRILLDVSTGECLAFVAPDLKTGELPAKLPDWAKVLDHR